jgi:hypothetical protein
MAFSCFGPWASHADGSRGPRSAQESCCRVGHRSVVVVSICNSETCCFFIFTTTSRSLILAEQPKSREINATRMICVHLASITNQNHRLIRCDPGLRNTSSYQAINGNIVRAIFRSLLNGRLEQQPYRERSNTLELCKTCRMARFEFTQTHQKARIERCKYS